MTLALRASAKMRMATVKVTINADGEVVLDVTNGEGIAALDLIHALQADARKRHAGKIDPEKVNTGRLNKTAYAAWEYLCESDCEEGVSVNAIARALGITDGAAGQRLSHLVKNGYARRVTLGRYRAETPAE